MACKIHELHSDVMVKALTMQIKRFISANELSAGKDESATGAAVVLHQARVLNTILAIGNIPTPKNYASAVARCKELLETPGGLEPQTANQIRQFLIIISFPMRMAEAQLELESKPIPSRINKIISSTWQMPAKQMLAATVAERERGASGGDGARGEDFLAGTMSRTEAEDVLRTRVNSTFLIRESVPRAGAYTISVRDADQVFHFRVGMTADHQVFIDPKMPFANIEGLVTYLQGQDSIGGYPARLRVPFRDPMSKLSHETSPAKPPPSARPYSAGDMRRRSSATVEPAESMGARTTMSFDKDVAMLQHQRAVSAAKGAVMLLYARPFAPEDEVFTEKKVEWIKHHLALQGWRVWIEADHVPASLGKTVAQQIVLAAVEMSSIVIGCISRGFGAEGTYTATAFEHARKQNHLVNRVFTIHLRDAPKESGGLFGLHMRKEKYYDQRFLMNSFWVKQLYREATGAEATTNMTRRIVAALSCDFITLREEEGADSVFAEPGRKVHNVPDLFELTVLSEATETVAKAATGSVVLTYDWGPRVGASFPGQDIVIRFAGLLQQNGYPVLLDTMHADGEIDDIMEIAIKRSAVVLACVSEDYAGAGSSSEKEWQIANSTKRLGESLFVVNLQPRPKPVPGGRLKPGTVRHSDPYLFTQTDESARFDLSACVNDDTEITPRAISQLAQLFRALDARGVRQHYPAGQCYSSIAIPTPGGARGRHAIRTAPAERSPMAAAAQSEELLDLPYYIGAQSAVLCRSMLGSRARLNEFVVRKLKPRSQDCKVYSVMVYLGKSVETGKDRGIFERLVLFERGKYRFADTRAGELSAFDSMADAIERIPEAKSIARDVVDMLYSQQRDVEFA
mmetsp:Transcript_17816/g.46513  ORF Transcript_17816/g.46513 Transcript_17816/m.46513 type:complete len:857 (-) Transcript_17816:89-2659(-)